MKLSLKRKVPLLIGLIFLFCGIFLLSFLLINAFKANYFVFISQAKRLISRSEEIYNRSRQFDETKTLKALGPNRKNGFTYRFDDRLSLAHFTDNRKSQTETSKDVRTIVVDFNDKDHLLFRPIRDNFVVEDGILKYTHSRSNPLQNVNKFQLNRDTIGTIEICMKVSKSKSFLFSWSKDPEAKLLARFDTNYLSLKTIPDSKFHTYRIDVANLLKGISKAGEPIRKIYLLPSDVLHDEIEIDFIRFVSKREKYEKQPYGLTYEIKNGETRKAIYLHNGVDIAYTLKIPEGKSIFKFGAGVLEENDPVQLDIIIKEADGETQALLNSITLSDPKEWQEQHLELTSYAGKDVQITISAKGSKRNIVFWTNPLIYTPPELRFNVLFVLEDALRPDHTSCYDPDQTTTPVKAEFCRKGVLFLNAYSQATTTRASCNSFMTSLYPSMTGVWNATDVLNDNYLTLAEIMRNQGYATVSFTQNINAGSNSGLHQGFSTVFDHDLLGERAPGIYSSPMLMKWLDDNSDRNFFIYLHIIDPHAPYDPPEEWAARYKKPFLGGKFKVKRDKLYDPDWLEIPTVESRNFLYNQEIKYNDLHFQNFLTALEKRNLLENTLIVFLADHGEHMGENLLWDHQPPGYVEALHVPLIMVYPEKFPRNKKIRQPVQLVDLFPTVLDLAGIKKENLMIAGDSLLSLIYGEEVAFWNKRFCLSEEVRLKNKDAPDAYGSIFYSDLHILRSENLTDTFAVEARANKKDTYTSRLLTRVFNPIDEFSENYSTSLLIDPCFNTMVKGFMNRFRKKNLETWRTLSAEAGETEETIDVDPAAIEKLRSLGYIE